MAAKKKASAKAKSDKKMTSPSKAGVRRREKATGTPKQSATAIKRRAQGERGAKRRIAADVKRMDKVNKQIAGAKTKGAARKAIAAKRKLSKSMAKRARLSKSAASGAG